MYHTISCVFNVLKKDTDLTLLLIQKKIIHITFVFKNGNDVLVQLAAAYINIFMFCIFSISNSVSRSATVSVTDILSSNFHAYMEGRAA